MTWEIALGRTLALCLHPATGWRRVSSRGRAAIVSAYFTFSYATVLGLLLAL